MPTDCAHPQDSVTWKYKGPGKTVTIIDGLIHGTCDDCGEDVYLPASFDLSQGLRLGGENDG